MLSNITGYIGGRPAVYLHGCIDTAPNISRTIFVDTTDSARVHLRGYEHCSARYSYSVIISKDTTVLVQQFQQYQQYLIKGGKSSYLIAKLQQYLAAHSKEYRVLFVHGYSAKEGNAL